MINIIIPAYNEEKRIEKTLEAYGSFFNKLEQENIVNSEILIVINNTTDKTEEIVRKYCEKYKQIRYLNFKERGKGFAIIEGFKDALKRDNKLIGFVDADMATSPQAFYDLIIKIKNFDGVIANRWDKKSKISNRTFFRNVTSNSFNFIIRSLFLMPYRDTQCGAKLFKRNVIEKILPGLNLTQWAFDINLLYLCGKNKFKIKQIPTVWEDKENSTMGNVPKTSLQMFLGILRLRLINSFFEPILRPVKFILRWADNLINK